MMHHRYRAFISYSHADNSWARWLHRSLEAYRLPAKLVGVTTSAGVVPKRLQPVFRDRDELPSATDLPGKVKEALADSGALIVVCSPSAAASRWVNEEIHEYRRSGRGDRIFAVIVDGDPQATGDMACFPPALLETESGDALEPLAADARKWGDGRRLATLKLLAGILDIPLDGLRRRDLQRRHRNWVLITVATVAAVLVVTLAASYRIAAEKRRTQAEQLVSHKLSELSSQLETPAPGAELARLDEWDPPQLQRIEQEAGNSEAERFASALERRQHGEELRKQGAKNEAMRAFRESWAILARLYAADRSNRQWFYELGQAEYWIGQLSLEAGDTTSAERSFLIYADISRRLLRSEPEDSDGVMEMTYALTNLGDLKLHQEREEPSVGLSYLNWALQFNVIAQVLDPENERYLIELEQSHAFLADAKLQVCDLGGALQSRLESTRLAREFFENETKDTYRRTVLAYALGGLARVQLSIGLVDQARISLEESELLLKQAAAQEPEKVNLQALVLERQARLIDILAASGNAAEASAKVESVQRAWQSLIERDTPPDLDMRVLYAKFLLTREAMERADGDIAGADKTLAQAIGLVTELIMRSPELNLLRDFLLEGVFRYAKLNGTLPEGISPDLIPDLLADERLNRSCERARLAARQAVLRGELQLAERYTAYLLSKGYYEPGFINFCRGQGLCPEH